MWNCPKCGRIFAKANQPHSCKSIPLEKHFENKDKAKQLFDYLIAKINKEIGKCQIISLPCCIHLYGKYDFLAVLPKKDSIEIRLSLDKILDSPRLKQSVPLSANIYKNCIYIYSIEEIDTELLKWLDEAYHLKDKN
ncbi:MAG: DUF5655 domain-containing protein [Candidatus Gottesmanbacteria bacterium]